MPPGVNWPLRPDLGRQKARRCDGSLERRQPPRPRVLSAEMLPASNFVCEFGECVRPTSPLLGACGNACLHYTFRKKNPVSPVTSRKANLGNRPRALAAPARRPSLRSRAHLYLRRGDSEPAAILISHELLGGVRRSSCHVVLVTRIPRDDHRLNSGGAVAVPGSHMVLHRAP